MLCSKCKIFSIHLPNYDSYICENGHVLCRTCNDNKQQCCVLCGGRIVRQAEFRLEGVPTAIFKERKRKDIASDVQSDRPESFTGSEEWFCQHPKDFDSDLPFEYEELNWNLNSNKIPIGDNAFIDFSNGRMHTAGDSNLEPRKDFTTGCRNINIVKHSKNSCKFKTPDPAECCMSFPSPPQRDPKELYKKTLKGEIDFDPKEDYYQRLAQVNEIEEFYRRPNLELARKSSSKIDFNKGITTDSDTTTLIDHFKEFQEATGYAIPANMEVYTLTTLPDPIILAKSKADNHSDNKHYNKKLNENEIVQLGLKELNENVDLSTMMDSCLEPCLNYISFTPRDEENVNYNFRFTEDKENREQVEAKSFVKPMKSLRSILREQLRSEVYSNFDKDRSHHTNNFITKTCCKPNPLDSLSPDPSKDINRSTLLEYINQEIEKALNKLSAPVEIADAIPAINKREELIQQSKKRIRDKLLREIYSNFHKTSSTVRIVQSKSEPSLNLSIPRSNTTEEEVNSGKSVLPEISSISQGKYYRTIGFSTESYPKLNPDFTVLSLPPSSDSQLSEQKRSLAQICKRCSHYELEKKASGEKHQPKISEFSKLSEGPFIQSQTEEVFEERVLNIKSTSQFQQESVLTAASNQAENVVQCVKYPEDTINNLASEDNYKLQDVLERSSKHLRQESNEKISNTLTLKDLKEKFPNMSVKQIKDIILSLPNECDEVNNESTDLANLKTINSENNASDQKRSEASENTSITTSVNAVAWRAFYSPMSNEDLITEPVPQYKPISFEVIEDAASAVDASLNESRPAADLNIPRSPVTCPLTACKKLIFVSEFSKHIKIDHAKIPVESVSPGKCKNLFLDPKIDHHGINKCHTLYLVTDKIRDLGSREYKNFLPVLVMSTKVNLMELIYPDYRGTRGRQFYLMIWLTGLNPTNMPIYFSLTAWSRSGPIPKCHIVHSGELYSIRNEQDAKTLFRTGQVLLLSQEQCSMLTNGGRNMLELQVVVH